MKICTKRALTLTLAVMVLATCLTACGGAPDSSSTPQTPSTTTTTTTTTASGQADTNSTSHTPTGTTTTTTRAGGKNESQDRSPQSNASTTTAAATNKGGAELLNKLKQIQPDWTEQQVYDLLGKPDRYIGGGLVSESIYAVDDTTEAVVASWSWGTEVWLKDTVTRKTRALRETARGQELLDKLKQIQPDWSHVHVKYLLGMYDRVDVKGDFAEIVYIVDDTTEAVIAYRDDSNEIYLRNTTTQQTSPLPK